MNEKFIVHDFFIFFLKNIFCVLIVLLNYRFESLNKKKIFRRDLLFLFVKNRVILNRRQLRKLLVKLSDCGISQNNGLFGIISCENLLNIVLIEWNKSLCVFKEFYKRIFYNNFDLEKDENENENWKKKRKFNKWEVDGNLWHFEIKSNKSSIWLVIMIGKITDLFILYVRKYRHRFWSW